MEDNFITEELGFWLLWDGNREEGVPKVVGSCRLILVILLNLAVLDYEREVALQRKLTSCFWTWRSRIFLGEI